ncbi:carboxylating nicotinate-nucleotide diphosphorylase [Marinagarivorans algicola]|uniref:carboxylating nicotinate-nucleotide diphosphorylase n=1 Tax=Marinagarivorans algicola TaxID=1513270 RepID=UPI003734D737
MSQHFVGLTVSPEQLQTAINLNAQAALDEDIQSGDITAELIPQDTRITARVITREQTTLCGSAWVDKVYALLAAQNQSQAKITWHLNDGDSAAAGSALFDITGHARTLLTGERAALNLLQTLCATAHSAKRYAQLTQGHAITLLDTRKTLPGLRIAQKYAVAVGGCHNHRLGLWDAFLIKENHIAACGGISRAIAQARTLKPGKPVQVEVETQQELSEALAAKADIIMLDNFSREDTQVILNTPAPDSVFEVSGNVELNNFTPMASCQPYRVSVGALTKHVKAVDLSFRVIA